MARRKPKHVVETPKGQAALAVLTGLAGVFSPIIFNPVGVIIAGCAAAVVILWIYWREATQAGSARQWHNGLIVPIGFLAVIAFLTFDAATTLAHAGGAPEDSDQVEELKQIDSAIAQKDEIGLRELYDFDNNLDGNIEYRQWFMLPPGREKLEVYYRVQSLFNGGQGAWNFPKRQHHADGELVFFAHPEKDRLINETKKYADEYALIQRDASSGEVPKDVADALYALNKTASEDIGLMNDTIYDDERADKRNILEAFIPGSPYFGRLRADYFRKFHPLKPAAENLAAAIRANLGPKH